MMRSMAIVTLVLTCPALGLNTAASFHSLGLVDEFIEPSASGPLPARPSVSGDGSTVAYASGARAFTWTLEGGAQQLAGQFASHPTALSYDGSVVVGQSAENDGRWYPAKWVNGVRSITNTLAFRRATDVSTDGNTMVGIGFKATPTTSWDLSQSNLTAVTAVSGNGQIVVANRFRSYTPGDWGPTISVPSAHLWQNWTVTDLGSLTQGEDAASYASGISADGRVVVGYSSSDSLFREAFRWTADGGMVGLGGAFGWDGAHDQTWMLASDADGSLLVGTAFHGDAQNPFQEQRAIMWDNQHGICYLEDCLHRQFDIDLDGWQLKEATGISDDGKTIVGWGVGPQGTREGFVFIVPEPAGLLLLAAVGSLVVVRRSGQRP